MLLSEKEVNNKGRRIILVVELAVQLSLTFWGKWFLT